MDSIPLYEKSLTKHELFAIERRCVGTRGSSTLMFVPRGPDDPAAFYPLAISCSYRPEESLKHGEKRRKKKTRDGADPPGVSQRLSFTYFTL